jgi:Permuted papain-like amidase enzyme, YaeF/YiiX, C92 family
MSWRFYGGLVMTRMFEVLGFLFFSVLMTINVHAQSLKTGDLIFQMSQSKQSAAIKEAQGSPYTHMGILIQEGKKWYVYEAVQPVKKTEISKWIARGKDKHFVVKRMDKKVLDLSTAENRDKLIAELDKFAGSDYDLFFEWTEEKIYCSELVYKAIERGFGVTIGNLQKIGDLNLEGPNVKALIKEREKQMGHPVDLEEPIITPVSMYDDSRLEVIATYSK